MAIPIKCSGCQASFDVPDTLAGKKIRCSSCKTQVNVPDSDSASASGSSAPRVAKAAPVAKVAAIARPVAKVAAKLDDEEKTNPNKASFGKSSGKGREPDDDDDGDEEDRPKRRKKKQAKASGNPMPFIIGGGIIALFAIVGVVLYFTMGSSKKETASSTTTAASDPGSSGPTPPPGPPGSGRGSANGRDRKASGPSSDGPTGMSDVSQPVNADNGVAGPQKGPSPNSDATVPSTPPGPNGKTTGSGTGPRVIPLTPPGGPQNGPMGLAPGQPPGGPSGGRGSAALGGPNGFGGSGQPQSGPNGFGGPGVPQGGPNGFSGPGLPQGPNGFGGPGLPQGGPNGFSGPGQPQGGSGRGGRGQPGRQGPQGPGMVQAPGMQGPGAGPGFQGFPGGGNNSQPPLGADTVPNVVGHVEPFFAVAFDMEKNEMVTISRRAIVGGKSGGMLRRYSFPDLKKQGEYKIPHVATRAAIDPTSGMLFIATVTSPVPAFANAQFQRAHGVGDIEIYDLATLRTEKTDGLSDLKPTAKIALSAAIRGMVIAPDGKSLHLLTNKSVAGKVKAALHQFDMMDKKQTRVKDISEGCLEMCLSPDGTKLLVTEDSNNLATKLVNVMEYDLESWTPKATALPARTTDVAFSKSGQMVAAAYGSEPLHTPANGALYLISGGTKEITVFGWKASQNNYVEFSPDGKYLFSSTYGTLNPTQNASVSPTLQHPGFDVYEVSDASDVSGFKKVASIVRTVGNHQVGGCFHLSPDGSHVIFQNGVVLAVDKLTENNSAPNLNANPGQQPGGPGFGGPAGPGIGGPGGPGFGGPGGGPGFGGPAGPGFGGPLQGRQGPGSPSLPGPGAPGGAPGGGGDVGQPGAPVGPGAGPMAPGAPGAPLVPKGPGSKPGPKSRD